MVESSSERGRWLERERGTYVCVCVCRFWRILRIGYVGQPRG